MDTSCISPESASRYLRPVRPKWRAFWFHMHYMVDNLEDFVTGLGEISDEVFSYHYTGHDNDYARWVQEVIGDAVMAEAVRSGQTREELVRRAGRRLMELKSAVKAG